MGDTPANGYKWGSTMRLRSKPISGSKDYAPVSSVAWQALEASSNCWLSKGQTTCLWSMRRRQFKDNLTFVDPIVRDDGGKLINLHDATHHEAAEARV